MSEGRSELSLLRNRRLVVVVTSCLAVVAIVAAMLLATSSLAPAVEFAQTGHWVVNRADDAVVHVDGGTGQADARVAIPGAGDSAVFALQGPTQGFLVGRDTITTFGKSSLTVDATFPTGQSETPYGIETIGGPYLVYRTAGTIVRLGETPTSVPIGGAVDRPVSTDDGTVWVHRTDSGSVCSLVTAEAALGCPVSTRPGAAGALTVLGGVAEFLDTGADGFQALTGSAAVTPTGVDLPDNALPADRDTQGRLPVLLPDTNRILLLDTSGVAQGRAGGVAGTIELGPGRYTSPAAADGIVAIIEQTRNVLLTFRLDGTRVSEVQLPPGEPPFLTRGGDGRIYVDDANGSTTHVINPDGTVTTVETGGGGVEAPPSDLLDTVSLPDLPTVPFPGQGGTGPVDGGPVDSGPGPIDPGQKPPPTAPPAPAGVNARVGTNGAVTVQWQPVDAGGQTVEYTARSNAGDTARAGNPSAAFTSLVAGQTYTFTVTATSPGGTSAPSAPSPEIRIPIGKPSPPTGLTMSNGGNPSGRAFRIGLQWVPPSTLNGGVLDHYEITGTDAKGGVTTSKPPGTATSGGLVMMDYCLRPTKIAIVAVTKDPGNGAEQRSPAATDTWTQAPHDCVVSVSLSAAATGPDSISVTLSSATTERTITANCNLLVNGVSKWTGTCQPGGEMPSTIPVGNLRSGTTYSVVMRITQQTGATTSSNTASVTTQQGSGGPTTTTIPTR